MSKQEMWEDPQSGKVMPYKVIGVGSAPTFRDDDRYDQQHRKQPE